MPVTPRARRLLLLALAVAALLLLAHPALAQSAGEGPSVGLTKRLYCYAYTLFASRVGLIIGLCAAMAGLWAIITERALRTGLTLILFGALISSITSLIESFYGGLAGVLVESRISGIGFSSNAMGFDSLGVENDITQCDTIYVAPPPPEGYGSGTATTNTDLGEKTPLGTGTSSTTPVNSQCVAGQACPRGIRNNNPGNIRSRSDGTLYPGQIGRDDKGFAIFGNMSDGLTQMEALLGRYASNSGKTTIADQISKWAPNNENDTSGYISFVVSQMRKNGQDVSANSTVQLGNSAFMNAYTNAMVLKETGRRVR